MATIKDVARIAGVSIATVSRVINNATNVKKDTVEKVNAAISECNFVPNLVARNLKNESTKTIGFLVSDTSNPYFMNIAKKLEDCVRDDGYDILICSTSEDPVQEKNYLNRLIANQAAGIVLNTTGRNNEFICSISENMPIVLLERNIDSPSFTGDFVGSNNYSGIQIIMECLFRNGHSRIGIINGDLNVSTGSERFDAFVSNMRKIGIAVDQDYPYRYDSELFSETGGMRGIEYLMQLPEPPTAVLLSNNSMAVGALKYLRRNDFRIPEDVSFVSFGAITNQELLFVQPSYVSMDDDFVGKKIADCTLSRIQNPRLGKREVVFESSMLFGDSIKNLSQKG